MRNLLALLLLAPCALLAQVPDYIPTDGLVAWYPMNGNALDESGNGYDCQSIGATLTEDRFGATSSAYAFDGQGSHLQGASLPFSDLSISLWFKADSGLLETYTEGTPPTGAQLIGQGGSHNPCRYCDWAIGITDWYDGEEQLAWEKANPTVCQVQQTATNWQPELGEWSHLAATSEGSDVSIYINGDWVSTIAFDEPFHEGGSIFSIGSRYVENCNGGGSCTYPDNSWSGSIDDVAVWNRALSTEEINALHSASNATALPNYVPTDGLVAWYPLDSTALDESGNGHHLTLDGPTWGAGTEDADDQALLFDGQDDAALIPHHPDFNSPEMSLSFWVNVHTDQLLDSPGLSDFMGMINKTDLDAPVLDRRQFDVQLYAEAAGTSPFNLGWLASTGHNVNELDVELVTAPANLPAFTWNHIVVTASDSTLSIHINGEHIATNGLLHPRVLNTADIQIGRDYLGLAQRHFNGRMDDIALYNRVLTQEEVLALFSATEENTTPNPSDAGWEYLGEEGLSTYWVLNEDMLWSEAMNLCEGAGGVLYWPNSMEEHMQVWSWLQQGNDGITYWTGVHQDFSQSPCSTTGNWIGPTGQAQTYFNWELPNEPNNDGGGESVVQFEWSNDGALWNDAPGQECDNFNCACSYARPILEMASTPVISGCTDPTACNYDPTATQDDGSCTYSPSLDLGEDVTLCEGDTATLALDLPGQEILWSTGSTEQEITVTESGIYSVEAGTMISPEATAVEFGPNQLGILGPAAPELDLAGTSELTLATWVKLNSNSHTFRLISTQSDAVSLQQYSLVVSDGRLYFISGSSSFEDNGVNISNTILPTDTWIHTAVTVSTDGVRFYLDGELDLFNPVNDVFPSGYNDMIVLARRIDGNGATGIPEQLDGSLSQVGIWNRALSAEEMATLPNCPPSIDSEGLIGLWLANQTPVAVVTDETGNGSDIDLTSGTVISGPEQSCSSCTATDQITVTFGHGSCFCGDGTEWDEETQQCVIDASSLIAPCGPGTIWDPLEGECVISIPTDTDFDGCISSGDLLNLLTTFGTCPVVDVCSECPEVPGNSGSTWSCGDPLPYQGYDYATVQIGDQCWFQENLRAASFSNGDLIDVLEETNDWVATENPAKCWYQNETDNGADFGWIYNGYAVSDPRHLCPVGWHISDWNEFLTLADAVGGQDIGCSALKSTTGWNPGLNGTDSVQFNALPAGYRTLTGSFPDMGTSANFWTTRPEGSFIWNWGLGNQDYIFIGYGSPIAGSSVRCLKD